VGLSSNKRLCVSILLAVAFGCHNSNGSERSRPEEAINADNDPRKIDQQLNIDLERRANLLPSKGNTRKRIWVGNWYPNSDGGTSKSRNGELSPLEKFEKMSGIADAHKWEVQDALNQKNVFWSGHCNGLAAASIMEEEPLRSVRMNGVTFSAEDIKALLVESWQNSGRTIGLRCDLIDPKRDEYGRPLNEECRDLNPATLHLAVTNFIGRFGEALIIDRDSNHEVWNWAISSYELKINEISQRKAAELVGSHSDGYLFNRSAKTFWESSLTLTLPATKSGVSYRYVLEGDELGRVFGGEWIGESKVKHPDFVWRPGLQSPANPYLDYELVQSLLAHVSR
jgi:hypothetical protein